METKEVVQKPNLLQAKFVIDYSDGGGTFTSSKFVINGVAQVRVRVTAAPETNSAGAIVNFQNLVFVRFTKQRSADNHTYMIYFNSEDLGIVDKSFTSDDGTWHLIHENQMRQFTFDVAVKLHLVPSVSSFASLHDDRELTDFELRGEDGAVRMHRAVLAAASPVLRRMLAGTWRETTAGHVDVAGTSKATLEHFKNYLYLQTLPESGLEQLLLLASYYMMPELEQACVHRLLQDVSVENVRYLIEVAVRNNLQRLLITTLECVQVSAISVADMHDQLDKKTTDADESK